MQSNRSDGEDPPRSRANPSPAVGNVCGLGESHALRVELQPVQLPWLADEINELRRPIEEAVAVERARYDQLTAGGGDPRSPAACENETEIARRTYQLKVLAMIREQLPIDDAAVAAGVASPWRAKDEDPEEPDTVESRIGVVGPAQGMLVLIRGATRNVTAALAEALAASEPDTFRVDQSRVRRWGERRRSQRRSRPDCAPWQRRPKLSPTPTSTSSLSSPTASTPTTTPSSAMSCGSGSQAPLLEAWHVTRTLRAMELLAVQPRSAPELADALGVHVRTARRVLKRLESEGYVALTEDRRRRYRPTMRVVALAGLVVERAELTALAVPHVTALRDELGEDCHLSVPSHLFALCLVHAPAGTPDTPRPQLRELVPCHCTAAGKALARWGALAAA